MNKFLKFSGILALAAFSNTTYGNEWVNNVQVTKLGSYQHSPGHFVWLSSGVVSDCQKANPSNPVLHFSEISPGGKSLMSVLMAAVVSKTTVDVQVNGCDIVEVYIK
ncbi:hypothetical protein Q8W40_27775 [Vibrio penaeicida]|uniref:hypothetical protein n=1 Tax=Vibrio penaeicida TaxID=104609 RepID=UPI002733BA25|nr:hypothetical protein [Vibrio penaeicida]MDP2576006.1 hypothetical protein [Vibrio penaeicida]